jgi:gp16 family phage-associated protein
MTKALKTADQVRAEFLAQGKTFMDFCRKHELNYYTVIDVLNGRSRAMRGDAHRAAVLLGMKDGRIVPETARNKRAPAPRTGIRHSVAKAQA